MLLTSFFAVAMYRHNVLENAAIAAVAARRWQVAGPKFPTIRPPSTFQWLLCTCVRGGMQRHAVAKKISPWWQCAAAAMVIGLHCPRDMQHVCAVIN